MDIQKAFELFIVYAKELFVPLLLGFGISGLINEFIPKNIVNKYLGKSGPAPILAASFFGAMLPVCCFGSLPVALTLHKKGARIGPVLAFLAATPATSISALMVSFKLMGTFFTFWLFGSVMLLGLTLGLLAQYFNYAKLKNMKELDGQENHSCCVSEDEPESVCSHCAAQTKTPAVRVRAALKYACITLPRSIGIHIIIGLALAAVVESSELVHNFIAANLAGALGYFVSLIFGLTTYVCSTASVPIAKALSHSGMALGAAFVYLLAGPITSYGTLLVLYKEFGGRTITLYVGTISLFALGCGYLLGVIQ